ncbi:MAG: tRNA guanosine(34) transglycosylase Tgt, partial [Candidatus Andersenbacteria bacterium]
PHGAVQGPFFQFVATQAAIRGMVFPEDLEAMEVQIVLANTYHLHLRPGEDVIAQAGGLHGFMNWNGPITTDSGGYQLFSLGAKHETKDGVKVTEDSVTFRSPMDGSLHTFTPETAIQIQAKLGADIIMPLDVCTPYRVTHEDVLRAVDQTTQWAKRCKAEHEALAAPQALYGIVQGSVYPDLRQRSAEQLRELDFFGYSIGGELQERGEKQIESVVRETTKHLPHDKPRYLMGYGTPEDIVGAVRSGVDHFDCVLPIRNARHGQLFYDLNIEELTQLLQDPERPIIQSDLYTRIDIRKSAYARDFSLLSANHPVIRKPYTKAYLHHLMRAEVPSGSRLAVLHNIWFYVQFMKAIRTVIQQ